MSDTIGNPLSWSADHARAVGQHLGAAATHVGHGEVWPSGGRIRR